MSAARAALLTELGKALGCSLKAASPKCDLKVTVRAPKKRAGFPACCYFAGPISELGPAPKRAPIVSLSRLTYLDREALALAKRGEDDLKWFFSMLKREREARVSKRSAEKQGGEL